MNKDLIDQLPADEQAVAVKLSSAAEIMKLSQSFQWNLETQLMDAYQSPKGNARQNSLMKFLTPAGWTIGAVIAVLLVSWMLRSLLPEMQPAAAPTAIQEASFEVNVRQGNICLGPLAVAHGFTVFLTNKDKTQFAAINAGNTIGEMRSFTWSSDGRQLSILGNTTGSGNIYQADPVSGQVEPVLAAGELGYMMDAAWSRDGKQVVMWSAQNNKVLYVMNADGTGLVEKNLGNTQILGAPQFWPDGSSVVFYGATPTATGLFEWILNDTDVAQINSNIESASSYAFSPDGTRLAYMSYDRELSGQAELWIEDLSTYEVAILGTFSIPKGSGSSVPDTANMSWSADGKSIVFDVGRGANDRVIYLAHADGTGMVKVVDGGYAPAISADGKCLSYISNKQVFLLDLSNVSSGSKSSIPLLLADLPVGRNIADYRLDKLQWRP